MRRIDKMAKSRGTCLCLRTDIYDTSRWEKRKQVTIVLRVQYRIIV
jgi:hypothetical protein